jgi:hypothetical protein
MHSVPVTEDKLCSFAAYLAHDGISYQTTKCYLSATKHLQIELGLYDPHINEMVKLEHVVRGIKREGSKVTTPKPRLPMTPTTLEKVRLIWEENPTAFDNIMLWAATCTCYFGFLRSGEICVPSDTEFDQSSHLCMSDIAVNSTSAVSIRTKASKTDPFRQGVTIYLGVTNTTICPVKAILAYIAARGTHQGPFFYFANGRMLTRERFVKEMRSALSKAGMDPDVYAGHSLRIGAATVAYTKGIEDSTIMTLGRWKSNAYQRYIRIPRQQLAKLSATIATPITEKSL